MTTLDRPTMAALAGGGWLCDAGGAVESYGWFTFNLGAVVLGQQIQSAACPV